MSDMNDESIGAFPFLVSTDWLADNLETPDVKIVDASDYLPTEGRDTRAEYEEAHIPGAVFFPLTKVVDPASDQPHALPPPEVFAKAVGNLGIGNDDTVIIYDTSPFFSAPRCWWLFKYFGHERAALLDGGLPKWRREGRPIAAGAETPAPQTYHATPHPDMVARMEDVRQAVKTRGVQIADARGAARFTAEEPEPRPGMKSGHMPGAKNVPYSALLDADGTFLPPDSIRERFESAGIDPDKPAITTCGSGVTAAVLALGLALLGNKARLYDGSWTEWGGNPDTPVETGPAKRPA